MSHLIFTASFSPIPQSSLVPDDEQAVRGHPATRSLSEHPPVLRGSDLITVPGPRCALPSLSPPSTQQPQIVISPPLPSRIIQPPNPPHPTSTDCLLLPPQGIHTSQIRSTVLRVEVFMSFIYLFFPPLPLLFFPRQTFPQTAFSAHFHRMPYRESPSVKLCLSLATARVRRP